MSLSNPTPTNPAQYFFEWKGGEGKLTFYDKEKQQRIAVPLPFSFIPLDQLHTITGFDKQAMSGYWANEIRDIRRDEFTIRTKGGVKYVGPYKNEQGIVQVPKGAGYTKSVYIAHQNKAGEWILGNVKLSGSALTSWIEFTKTIGSPENVLITMEKGDKQTSPVGDFYPPTFTSTSYDGAAYDAAVELDRELQRYLDQYLAAPKYEEPATDDPFDTLEKATPEQQADFAAKKTAGKSEHLPDPFELGDEPINLDEIPF